MKLNYFNFKPFGGKILMTNDYGNYIFVSPDDFKNIIAKRLDKNSELYTRLINEKMIYDSSDIKCSSENKYALKDTKNYIYTSTSLHIFVMTTACNMNCCYCQANSGKNKAHLYMDKKTAKKAVDIALQTPEKFLSFEFQGGEPLLNFEAIKFIVLYAEENKGFHDIKYNVVTNLTLLTNEILEFLKKYDFGVSTSLDGPKELHNYNRPFTDGTGTYDALLNKIERIKNAGLSLGAIETTTKASIAYPEEIVQTYKDLGFDSIFLRPLTPLGKATINWSEIGYTADEFIDFYKRAFKKLLKINADGYFMKESHASIFLNKINGNLINYMELRSPCGAGIGQLAYFADGNIFTCDEARMLYEMGYDTFYLGNVFNNNFNEIINSGVCKTVCACSVLETIPSCCDCVYQPFCGVCPVVNYAVYDDVIEKTPRGYRCKIYSGILDLIFNEFFSENKVNTNILNSWSN